MTSLVSFMLCIGKSLPLHITGRKGGAGSPVPRRLLHLLSLSAFVCTAFAQLPSPRLDTIFPPGGRAGAEVEVTLTAADLADATALVFDPPGFTATKLEPLKFRVAIAADCALGLHEVRAAGRYGVSTPLPFVVGDAPELLDPGTNRSRETALLIPTSGAVHGRADAELRDFYKVTATKGQALHIDCVAFALDSPMDPVVTITDAKGATLARADDERDRDARLVFTAPGDGEYFIAVQDKLFSGSAAHLYRLAIALAPPASPAEEKTLTEIEPNDDTARAQRLALPAEVRGAFDSDWFSLHAEAGKPVWLEVVSERDGHASDAVLVVHKVTRDAAGAEQSKQVLELDDQAELPAPPRWLLASRDPAARFVPDETATYRLRLTDRFAGRASYRLIVRDAAPDFVVVALGESLVNEDKKLFKWQPNLRRGGSAAFAIAALRRGHDGDIALRAEGLPAGVTASGLIPTGAAAGTLVFHAAADAAAWSGNVRVVAEGGGISREVRVMNYRWNVANRDEQRLAGRLGALALGIAEETSPLTITLAATALESAIGADLEIALQLSRPNAESQPKGEWLLSPVGLPGFSKFDPIKFDGAAANGAKILPRLQNKDGNTFKPGTYTVVFRASGVVAYKAEAKAPARDLKHVEFSTPLTLKLIESPAPPVAAAK